MNVSKVYIIHYKKLLDRKNYLTNFFNQNNLKNYEFRQLYQRENLTKEIRDTYFLFNKAHLNDAVVCITIEHIETYKEIVKNSTSDDEWYLILEDDAILCYDFVNKLNEYLEHVPSDAEYLDISDYRTITSPQMWVKMEHTRTNVSYLINRKTCAKILSTIIPFEDAIDHELNKQFKNHNITPYWSNISLVHHGSGTNYKGSYSYSN